MSEIVKNSCPHYRYKPKENKVTTCDGDVEFVVGRNFGICLSCEKEVPLIVEI